MNPLTDGIRIDMGLDLFAKGFAPAELESAYYDLISDREQERLLFEAASLDEVDEFYNDGEPDMVMESIKVKRFAQTESKMRALVRVLNTQALKGIAALDAQIGPPRKSGLFATVTVQIPMTDGQILSIVFHSPTGDEKKILPDDMIVAFRWLLNKRDITHTVSPEWGKDVSLQTVAKRVMQIVAKNSEAFQRSQSEIQAQKDELATVEQSVKDIDAANQQTVAQIADMKIEAEQVEDTIEATRRRLEKVRQENDDLEAQLEALRKHNAERDARKKEGAELVRLNAVGQARVPGVRLQDAEETGKMAEMLDLGEITQAEWDEFVADLYASGKAKRPEPEKVDGGTKPPNVVDPADLNPTDPTDYAKILADPALQLEYQDILDSFFQERFAKLISYMKEDGWIEQGTGLQKTVGGKQYNMMSYFKQVGAGKNIVGASYEVFSGKDVVFDHLDDLGHDVQALATWINSAATGPEVGILPPAEQIDGNPAKRAAKILHSLGKAEAAMKDDFHVKLKSGAYQDLSIETHDEGGDNRRIYFTHYIEEGGDLIIDSEMVFQTNIYTGYLKLAEIGYRGPMGEVRRTSIGRAEKSWANTFSKNLVDQGFEKGKEAGEEVAPEPAPEPEKEKMLDILNGTPWATQRKRFAEHMIERGFRMINAIGGVDRSAMVQTEFSKEFWRGEEVKEIEVGLTMNPPKNDVRVNIVSYAARESLVRAGGKAGEDVQKMFDRAYEKINEHEQAMKQAGFLLEPAPQPTPEPEATGPDPNETAALQILDSIIGGQFGNDTAGIDAKLDEAAGLLEALGKMDLYDDRLNAAADELTKQLAEKAKEVA